MPEWHLLLAVGTGGFFGAITRYLVSLQAQRMIDDAFPLGTLIVNVSGCFLIGLFLALIELRQLFNAELRLLIVTGFLGSLTTFSTFGLETFVLLREGQFRSGCANIVLNLVTGLIAVYLGRLTAELFR